MQAKHYDFLKGGGEMGERMRSFNWSQTPVGALDTWPSTLRTAVSILLNSKFPMFMMWGKDYIQFYNDAFRPSFGDEGRHPAALGQKARECWREAWDFLEPLLEQVSSGSEPIWMEDQPVPIYRNGHIETSYWTFSYSPVLFDNGEVGGVLSTCFETTQKVNSLRELHDNREELHFAIETTELGTWDLNPATGKFSANERLKGWFGLRPEDNIPLDLATNVIAEKDRGRVVESIQRALDPESDGRYEEIYTIINQKDKQPRIVLARGRAWFDNNKVAYRLNGTLQDITEQQQMESAKKEVEEKVAESRRQLLDSFENSPVALASIDKDGLVFRMANSFYGSLVGRKPADIIGKSLLDALPELTGQGFDKLLEQVIKTGVPFSSKEVSVDIVRDGKMETINVDLVYQPQYNESRTITGVLVVATDVTQQVRARKTIEESEAKFRSLVEEAPVATCLFVGNDMVIEVANDQMLQYWGKDKSIIGRPLIEAIPELEGQPFRGLLRQVFTSGEAHHETSAKAELVVDGKLQTFYFDYTYKPLRNVFGQVYGIVDMAIDVTEQVLSRKKLEESERFARHIFYNSPVAKLVFVGRNMVLREANQAMLDIFGRDASIINQPIMESIPELQQTDLLQKYLRVIDTGEAHYEYGERILLIRNGEKYWGYYDYIYKPLLNTKDEIYGVVCTAIDVTRDEISKQQIEATQETLSDAIELAELATWKVDLVNKKIEYSSRLQEWVGVTGAELEIGESPRIHPDDRDRVGKALNNAILPGGNGHFDETYKIINKQTGAERIIHSTGRAIFDKQGHALSINGTAQDVTLQHEMQIALQTEVQQRTEELETTVENLSRSNEELAQYAYVASHDLQEPLRKIRMFSGLLDESAAIPETDRKYIKKINQSAERMTMLIRDLLEFSRIVNNDAPDSLVDLNKTLQEVLNDFELMISEKKAVIESSGLPVVQAISLQMNQLFFNLVSNSLKFVAPGTAPVIRIDSSVLGQQDIKKYIRKPVAGKRYFSIRLQDNGIGFDKKYEEQIYEVFKRLHARDTYPGSGIGLSLCRRIVLNHGGYMYSESVPDKGTVFYIILPE